MKILILGGSGFIGSAIKNFLQNDHEVSVLCRNVVKDSSSVKYIYSSFQNIDLIQNEIKNFDIIIHAISTTFPCMEIINPYNDILENVLNTIKLLEIIKNTNIKLIFLSSGGAIYGNNEIPITEEMPLNPISSYGISKVTIEKYINLYKLQYGLNSYILRISNPYGYNKNKIGIQGIIPTLFFKLLNDQNVEIWGDGENIRDFIYIKDLVSCVNIFIKNDFSGNGVYNIGSGQITSINDVIYTISDILNVVPKIQYKPSKLSDVRKNILDLNKFKQISNYIPKYTLSEGCLDFYKIYQHENYSI